MNQIINEDSRSQLLQRSKKGKEYVPSNQALGKNRYERRTKSKISNSTAEYNKMNMNRLFKDNIVDITVKVQGETDIYYVKMSFGGFLQSLQGYVEHDLKDAKESEINLKLIMRALVDAYENNEVYISCTCPDWRYRMGYWATLNDINSGEAEPRPSKETNPNDDRGPGCKHTLLVLSNRSWLIKTASVIHNYINYMRTHYEQLYADVIYPAIFDKEYEGDVQLSLINNPDDIVTVYKDDKKHTVVYHGKESASPYAKYNWEETKRKGEYQAKDSNGMPMGLLMTKGDLATDTDILDISNKWAKTKNQFKAGNKQGIRFASTPPKQIAFDKLISDED